MDRYKDVPESNPRYQGHNIGIGYRAFGAGHIMDDMVDGEMTDSKYTDISLNVGIGITVQII